MQKYRLSFSSSLDTFTILVWSRKRKTNEKKKPRKKIWKNRMKCDLFVESFVCRQFGFEWTIKEWNKTEKGSNKIIQDWTENSIDNSYQSRVYKMISDLVSDNMI